MASPALGTMEVQVPQGSRPGQLIQATSPEGYVVQAEVPRGMKPGGTFTVNYPIAAPSAGSDSSTICGFRSRDVLIVVALIIFAIVLTSGGEEYHEGGGQQTVVRTKSFTHHARVHGIIIFCVICAVVYDWNTLGPTLALQHGAIAGVVSWLFVVPLAALLGSFSVVAFFIIAIVALIILTVTLGPLGIIIGVLLIVLVFVLSTFFAQLLTGSFGIVIIFLMIFWVVRAGASASLFQKVDSWPYVTQINPSTREFQQQVDYFMAACMPWEHKFDFALTVQNLYRIDRPGAVMARMPAGDSDGTRLLFHGTGWESAKAIICDGFKLPTHAGMFGRGIYFADCPLKSWRYCFPSRQQASLIPRMTGRGGLILMCRVELGEVREEREAAPALSGYNRDSWSAWFTRQRGAYDSVKGVEAEEGGALRVPEYVVYRPDQAIMSYMFEVRTAKKEERRGRAPQANRQNGQE